MPLQTYRCPSHGEFDIRLSFSQDVPQTYPCTGSWCGDDACCDPCGRASPHVIKPPAGIIVQGGTGAGRGHTQARKDAAWDARANEQQHDPYTQAKYQLDHVYNEQKAMGGDVPKPTEASIQEAARQIAAGKQPRQNVLPMRKK